MDRVHLQNLWTFVEVEGAEPANNAAEQALRQAVIWQNLSFAKQQRPPFMSEYNPNYLV
jgi:hypothetical protein